MSGNLRRRRAFIFILIALGCALSWHGFLSLALKEAVRFKLGCQLAFREMRFQEGKIILEDAVLFDSSYHLRAEKIRIALGCFQKPISVQAFFYRPHLTLLDAAAPRAALIADGSSKWFNVSLAAEEGTFEWVSEIRGRFSLHENSLRVEMGDGNVSVEFTRDGCEKKVDCLFENWEIAPFAERLRLPGARGRLNGQSHLTLNGQILEQVSGRLSLKECAVFAEEGKSAGGAALLEWEGTFPKTMKLRFQDAYASRGSSRLAGLDGVISFNQDVGVRWEMAGPAFAWEGKGFFQHRALNWLESGLRLGDAKAAIFINSSGIRSAAASDEKTFSLELTAADFALMQLAYDFWPSQWPCRLKQGTVSGRFEWKEKEGQICEWSAENGLANDLRLEAADWHFHCHHAALSAVCKGQVAGSCYLKGGDGHWGLFALSDLHLNGQISEDGKILGISGCLFNGLELQADLEGLASQCKAEVFIAMPSQEIEARAEVRYADRRWSVSEADFQARHLDLVHLCPLLPIKAQGWIDLLVHYAPQETTLEVAGSQLLLTAEAGTLCIPELPIVKAFRAQDQWKARSPRFSGECFARGEKIPIEGHFDLNGDCLSVHVIQGHFAQIAFSGDLDMTLEDKLPFSFLSKKLEGEIGFLTSMDGRLSSGNGQFWMGGYFADDPCKWHWCLDADLSHVQWGPLVDGSASIIANSELGLIECGNLQGNLSIGEANFPIRGVELRKRDDDWLFDVRIEHRFWDLARLSGSVAKNQEYYAIAIDPVKSKILGSSLNIHECRLQSDGAIKALKLTSLLSWKDLLAASASIVETRPSFAKLLQLPIVGACSLDVDLRADNSSITLCGHEICYDGAPIPFQLRARQQKDHWMIEHLQLGSLEASCRLAQEESERWKMTDGKFHGAQGWAAHVSGYLESFFKCELQIDQLLVDLQKTETFLPSLTGELEGKGFLTLEWDGALDFEADLDLRAKAMQSGTHLIDNAGPMQLHVSKRQGLLIRGLDLRIHEPDLDWIHARIGLMQFDFTREHWVLHHSQIRLSANTFSIFRSNAHPLSRILQMLDPQHDLEFSADIDCAADFSSLVCSMREGFVPFLGAVRHLQNVNLHADKEGCRATLHALHQGHSLKISASMQFDNPEGLITLEDEEYPLVDQDILRSVSFLNFGGHHSGPSLNDPSSPILLQYRPPHDHSNPDHSETAKIQESARAQYRPLAIEWEIQPEVGLVIHSIEGMFGGIEASFHAEARNCLIGSARLHFGHLSEILPARISQVFQQLNMGKGYELKGRLFYGPQSGFKGLLSGKGCELFGCQVRTLLAQVEADASRVRLFEFKASDSAGILKIDDLVMSQSETEPWRISMPSLRLLEFRPSLLQKVGREVGNVGPLVVRELKLADFRGLLEESLTYTAKGELTFVNSFKREHTVFDLPADFLGRIFGLDLELLIPVKGNLKFELKEGRLWLNDLQDAYSEGKRSKFFLVKDGLSPSVDFDGNLNILVKMKQYVLFKFTENFLLSIDGSMENPSYHLQKRKLLVGY